MLWCTMCRMLDVGMCDVGCVQVRMQRAWAPSSEEKVSPCVKGLMSSAPQPNLPPLDPAESSDDDKFGGWSVGVYERACVCSSGGGTI